MKKIRYCKITILILAGWAILSAIGFLGKDTIYSRYTVDPVKTPYFVLVMQGIHDGIYPWSSDHESLWDKWEHLAELRRDEEQISATGISRTQCLSVTREPWDFMITADSMTALFMRPSA